ncbi:hypothetical protein LQW54_005092 [Pestalotiopsis sp. IQ-011]
MKISPLLFAILPAAIACQQPPTELRTYTLTSANATTQYTQIWKKHLVSLEKFNDTTRAVWNPENNDKQVIALIQYAMGDDPANVTAAYMASEYFAEDMSGFSFSNFERTV